MEFVNNMTLDKFVLIYHVFKSSLLKLGYYFSGDQALTYQIVCKLRGINI